MSSVSPTSRRTARPSPKPKVYFEEWDDPLISGIGWVSELIEIAGGEDILPKLRFQQAAKDRIILPDVVRAAAPDVILASWCGKKVVPDKIRKRPGWNEIPAVRNDRIVEIKSPLILQPGPAALTDGLDAIVAALWPARYRPALHPAPFRDEQRGRLGGFPQRLQIDIFVEAVHRRTAGAEAQARDVVVQPVEPGVGQRGEHEVRDRAAIDRVDTPCRTRLPASAESFSS